MRCARVHIPTINISMCVDCTRHEVDDFICLFVTKYFLLSPNMTSKNGVA